MRCVDEAQLLRVHAGQVSAEELEHLQRHLAGCPSCAALRDEIDGMAGRFAPDAGEFRDPDFTAEVMTRIRSGRADREFGRPARPPWRTVWRRWLLVPATVAAAAALLIAVWPRLREDPSGALQARGGSQDSPDRWVSLSTYRRVARGYEPVQRDLRPGDALAFAYLNRPPSAFRYLMVFAVDRSGQVFWYYPAHVEKNENPKSIAIAQGARPRELPDEVRHAWAAGPLRIVGLFSKAPLDVHTVEQTVARQLAAAKTVERLPRIAIAGAGQHSQLLRVVAPAGRGSD